MDSALASDFARHSESFYYCGSTEVRLGCDNLLLSLAMPDQLGFDTSGWSPEADVRFYGYSALDAYAEDTTTHPFPWFGF